MGTIEQLITENFAIYNADCISIMEDMPSDSIHLSVYSPPFGGLYNYSSSDRDLSNADGYDGFFEHYAFVVSEVFRLTMPGRITAVHCSDIPSGNCGKDCLVDFPGDVIRLHERLGFDRIASHIIWKEPLWVRNRTMCKNLSHRTIVDDAAYGGVASNDFLIIFRKRGANKIPIEHPTGMNYYAGECPIPGDLLPYKNWTGDQKQNRFSHWIWRRYASSIWDDINMGNVLPFQKSKDKDDEKHVHPLQLDIIERCVTLRSNIGENVLTPFMGVGSEVYGAIKHRRKGIGIELKPSYYRQAVQNVQSALSNKVAEETDMFGDTASSSAR